jgi:mono/diheme cytochrome c family protein
MAVGEVLLWLLFAALLLPFGFAGWAIGHSTAGATRTVVKTVTVAAPAPTSTTTAAATTPAATTTAATTTAATKASAAPTAAGNAAKGKSVFLGKGCGSCHTFKPAGASATIGPDLDTKPTIDAKKQHMPLAAFIRESIVKPNSYISPGYPKGVMPQNFGTTLSSARLAALVAFLQSGAK